MTDLSRAAQLEKLRRNARVTKGQVVQLLGVTRPTYDRWLREEGELREKQKSAILNALLFFKKQYKAGKVPLDKDASPSERQQQFQRLLDDYNAADNS